MPRGKGSQTYFIVNKKLRCHGYKSKSEKESVSRLKNEAVPSFVLVIIQAVYYITRGQWETNHTEIFKCHFIKFRRFRVFFFSIFFKFVGRTENPLAGFTMNRFETLNF